MGKFIDKTGQTFNELTVLKYLGKRKYLCRCSCGKEIEIFSSLLNEDEGRKKQLSCGHLTNVNKPEIEDFFNEINSEKKAYILGFIAADGCIQPELNRVKIELKDNDEDILIKIQEAIGHKNKLSHYYQKTNYGEIDSSRLIISSKRIVKDLEKIGLTKNKSKTLNVDFNLIEEEYIRDFLRGLFDGDGCISFGETYHDISLTSSKIMADKIYELTSKELGNNKWYKTLRNKDKLDTVTLFATNKYFIKDFLNFIYKNSEIYLDRKYKLYLKYLEKY